MGKLLYLVITYAMSGLFARILTSIGFAVLGSLTFSQFIEYFLSKALSALTHVPFIGLVGLAGIDKAISIYITAVMIRVYLSTATQSLKLVKK